MNILLPALIACFAGILVLRFLLTAQPHTILRVLKALLGLGIAGFGAVISLRGMYFFGLPVIGYGLALVAAGLGWRSPFGGRFPGLGGGGGVSDGGSSDVRTRFLDMSLDHDSGDMDGLVREGPFQGRRLSELTLTELMALLRRIRLEDPESERLLEAWLDRAQPDWRHAGAESGENGENGAENDNHSGARRRPGPMTRAEALAALALTGNPGAEEVRDAYKRQMKKHHPDQGGTDADAARLNEARDLLL